jgi:hypothetical protein
VRVRPSTRCIQKCRHATSAAGMLFASTTDLH